MKLDPNVSVYIQLADYLKLEIFSGKRNPGSKMESIRDMAVILEVNMATVKRVYQTLIEDGLIYAESTAGNYVTKNIEAISKSKEEYVNKEINHLMDTFSGCGIDNKELIKRLEERINAIQNK